MIKHRVILFLLGLAFGFALVRAGATDPDAIAGMFLFTDLHLVGVIGVAVLVAGAGFHWLRRRRAADVALAQALAPKPMVPGLLVGAALFGAGWALTGTCPGTGLAQVGEGRWMGLFTVAGILAGSALHARVGARLLRALRPAPDAGTPGSGAVDRRAPGRRRSWGS
jgi:uncharacterized membrane protein YedE/YeeE